MSELAMREFRDHLTGFLPKMRVWALGLTQNREAAEDLVQDVAVKLLLANESFVPGTNFSAWVHKIMINHFISSVRNKREHNDLDQAPEINVSASQEERAGIRELNVAYQRLPKEQKEALHLIGLQEQSYEEAAEATGCAVGTLESRVHRARTLLREQMCGEIRDAA
jgi:RNA polymerase sigma-70 factor (ECF subfamily)